jgi:hypothetical protein
MKQTIKNFGKALLGLVMQTEHQPLSKEWIEANDKEIKKSMKNSAFRPPHFKKFNTTVKNEFKTHKSGNDFNNVMSDLTKIIHIDKNKTTAIYSKDGDLKRELTTEQKLKQALADLDSQPGYNKWEKSDKEYIKCDGTGTITHRDDVYYYAPSDLHLSKKFFEDVTKEQLQNDFDIDGDDQFRGWFLYTLLKIREE